MFAVLTGLTGELAYLEFGDVLLPKIEIRSHLRWVVDDYPRRRDEQWRFAPGDGAEVLAEMAPEFADDTPRLVATILAIGWYAQPEYAKAVHAFERHPNPVVKKAVVRALGQMGNFRSVLTVARALEENDAFLRRENIIASGKFGLPKAVDQMRLRAGADPELLRLVQEGKERIDAVQAIAKDEDDLAPLVWALIKTDEYEDLCAVVPFAFRDIARVLFNQELPVEIRCRAARVLGLGRAANCLALLCGPVVDDSAPLPLRVECATAIGRLALLGPVPGIVDFLLPKLGAPEEKLQDEIITAVGRTGAARALEPLLAHWDDRQGKVQDRVRNAVRALAPNDAAEDLLRRWLWWNPHHTGVKSGVVRVYLVREKDFSRDYREDWVYPELDRPERDARRDALLILALVGTKRDLPRIERVTKEDPVEENRWLATVTHRRIATATP